jgi:hypothetical protein
MPTCRDCSRNISFFELVAGVCNQCKLNQISPNLQSVLAEAAPAIDRSELPAGSTLTNNHKLLLGGALLVAVLGAGFWFLRQGQISDAYVDAAAECKAGLGLGRMEALDQLYGKDAQPPALRFDLSMCKARQAINDLERLNALLKTP